MAVALILTRTSFSPGPSRIIVRILHVFGAESAPAAFMRIRIRAKIGLLYADNILIIRDRVS
jgi:hypothetical protein